MNKIQLEIAMEESAIKIAYKDISAKIAKRPNLYVKAKDDGILCISLPHSLKYFCNRKSGRASDHDGQFPTGIAVKSDNCRADRDAIFESLESFTDFLYSSACDWESAPATVTYITALLDEALAA